MNKKILSILFAGVFLIGSQFVYKADSTTYKITHYGNCGAIVFYQVVAPIDIKILESFSVDITFNVNENIRASTFYIWINGAGTSWENEIADDGELVPAGTIVKTATLAPTKMEAVWVEIHLGFYDSGDDFYFGSSGFGIGMAKYETYNELQSENSELSYDLTTLNQSYNSYRQAHSHSDSEYASLNSTYNSMKSSHNSLQEDYDRLKSQTAGDLPTTRNLMYVLLMTTLGFGVAAVYFAFRKPKVKTA